MGLARLPLVGAFSGLPPEWSRDPIPAIRSALRETGRKIVILDDDPTGTQTVHDVPVLTRWSVDTLADELQNDLSSIYLLLNSRSLGLAEACALHTRTGGELAEAARRTGRDFVVASRSDSTLRGHFPGEVEALADALGQDFDAWILVPYFLEGGRYTINDVHYVAEGDWLVPAGETEFARDPAFAYRSSNLRDWVEEKTGGKVPARSVASVSIEDLRLGGPERVTERLGALSNGGVCIVNAVSMRDMEVFALGVLNAIRRGQRFLFRTAASFLRAISGLRSRSLVKRAEMDLPETGGALIVVGSYVPRSSVQLAHLLDQQGVAPVEIDVESLLSDARREGEIERVARETDRSLDSGEDVVVYTGRRLVTGRDAEESLSIGKRVSAGIVDVARAITVRPRYIIAKGGVTASDIATEALGVRRTMVPGQVLPGVPVWVLGPESRYPGLRYIVFPGNVGGPEAVTEVVSGLRPGGI